MHQYLEQECQQQQGAINFWDASSNTSHRSHASNSRKASNIRDTNNSRNTSKSMEACSKDILPTKVAKIEKRRLQQNKNLYNQGSQQQQGSEQYIAEMQACNTCSFDISSSAETSEQWQQQETTSSKNPGTSISRRVTRKVSPFRFKKIFAYKWKEAKLDPFRMCFACSLQKFRSIFSLLFAVFRFKFFASLQLSYFRFEAKWTKNLFSLRIFCFASKNTFIALFASQCLFRIKFFADCIRTDSYTLVHIFKPIHTLFYTHIDTPVQTYIYRQIQSCIDTHI